MFKDKRLQKYQLTLILGAFCIITYTIHLAQGDISLFGQDLGPSFIESFRFNARKPLDYYGLTLLTSFFLHGHLAHLVGSLSFFLFFSALTEPLVKKIYYLFFIISTQVTGLLLLALFIDSDQYFIGSSLATYALLGLYSMRSKKYYIIVLGSIFATITLFSTNYNWTILSAHMIGLGLGVLFSTLNLNRKKAHGSFHIN